MIGLDLFAGAGGMSLGARSAGIDVRVAVENDANAATTYKHNHPTTHVLEQDVSDVGPSELEDFVIARESTVLFGGPPCQGFSYSNPRFRRKDNPANWLLLEFLRIARIIRPAWIVLENVQGIRNTAGGVFVRRLEEELCPLRYEVTQATLNASAFGVPQERSRFFLVASRGGRFEMPRACCRTKVTVSEAIGDLPKLANGASKSWLEYGSHDPSSYALALRGNLRKSSNHLVSRNSPLVLKRYSHIPEGGNWTNIPRALMKNYKDPTRCHTGIYHRLAANRPSIVIGNYRKNMLIHPSQDRGLSVREAARIQSFPDCFEFKGSIGFQQQEVANAVPPLLAKAVFSQILNRA